MRRKKRTLKLRGKYSFFRFPDSYIHSRRQQQKDGRIDIGKSVAKKRPPEEEADIEDDDEDEDEVDDGGIESQYEIRKRSKVIELLI